MHTFTILTSLALAAASPLGGGHFHPPPDCEGASPCINPNEPCPCWPNYPPPPTEALEARAAEPTTTVSPVSAGGSVDCRYKCPPCKPGQDCPLVCDPLPLPPQCDQCRPGCKPCRNHFHCPTLCVPVKLPPQCPKTDPFGNDSNPGDGPKIKRSSGTIEAQPLVAREDTVETPTNTTELYGNKCIRKCPPCLPGQHCPLFCDPLPLPPQCDQCKPGCKPCRGKICPALCIPVKLPPRCPKDDDQVDISATPTPAIEARAAPSGTASPPAYTDPSNPDCTDHCPPCLPGRLCPIICDPLPLPPGCDPCRERCKPCRKVRGPCPDICELVEVPAFCSQHEVSEDGIAARTMPGGSPTS